MPLIAGTGLGPYEIVVALGAGGMGEVYRARDARLGRDVAVKVLPAAVATDADRRARFEREARAVAALSHPNILAIFEFAIENDTPYVVTELLEGQTLRELLAASALPGARAGALTVRKAVDVATQISRGLAAAHDKGIVHRDLKPENVFVSRDGHVKILDFGLAKAFADTRGHDADTALGTDPGTVVGTVGYMAPEQIRGDDAVVRHCLERNPNERFQSARDLAFNLQASPAGSGSSPASTVSPMAATRRARVPREAIAWTVAGVFAIASVAGFVAWRGASTPSTTAVRVRFQVPPPLGKSWAAPLGRGTSLFPRPGRTRSVSERAPDGVTERAATGAWAIAGVHGRPR